MYLKQTLQVFWFQPMSYSLVPVVPSIHQMVPPWPQVEQLENQLRAKGGVAPKPGSGGAGGSQKNSWLRMTEMFLRGEEELFHTHGWWIQKLQVLLALWLVLVMRVLNIRVMVALVRASLLAMTCWTMLYGSSFGMLVWVIGGRALFCRHFLEMPTTHSFFAWSMLICDHRGSWGEGSFFNHFFRCISRHFEDSEVILHLLVLLSETRPTGLVENRNQEPHRC